MVAGSHRRTVFQLARVHKSGGILERSVRRHGLQGSEIFIFTDNSTSEAAFWNGTSSSPLLFDLVLRLRQLEMTHNIIVPERGRCSCRAIGEGAAETPGVHACGCSSPIDDGSLAQALGSRHRRRFRDKIL
jgi:hypothetical protein